MIFGLGSDIVQIPRIEEMLSSSGERFIQRVFTPQEQEGASKLGSENMRGRSAYFAKRFAAKEAFAKAIGHGFRDGLAMKDIGVVNDAKGKPILVLSERAKLLLDDYGCGTKLKAHISLSDDYPVAFAVVVLAHLL